jgi:hypothetical protein
MGFGANDNLERVRQLVSQDLLDPKSARLDVGALTAGAFSWGMKMADFTITKNKTASTALGGISHQSKAIMFERFLQTS